MDTELLFSIIFFGAVMLGAIFFGHMSEDEVKCRAWKTLVDTKDIEKELKNIKNELKSIKKEIKNN